MKKKKASQKDEKRKVALCYVRQSFTRDGEDMDSPDRQKANIEAKCQQMGWTPEWYQDADGHKSGRYEKNRPGWLALKERLNDPDVVSLVANDLARLHRKGWRVGDLIDYLDDYDVSLVLAAPGREIDLSTPMGRLFVQFTAILDEWYAADISARAKDNIAHRKAQGKSVGMPPFGTIRSNDGYLIPSTAGVWLMSDGTFQTGEPEVQPENGIVWRSHFETARYILTLYANGDCGLEKISYTLNNEGWPFRDRTGKPRPINRDDIRRVVANWPEYGGLVFDKQAKNRPGYEDYDVDELPFNTDRSVFPISLLKGVARVRQQRTIRPLDKGVKRISYPYPLSVIAYCRHCEQVALQHNNAKLRTTFTGRTDADGTRRYRHKRGVKCGCASYSVPCEVLESDFSRLVKLLTVSDEALEHMQELAIQAEVGFSAGKSLAEIESERQEAIALCRRRIEATVTLYGDGLIDAQEYRRRIDTNQREINHWENRTSESEQMAIQLAMCMEAVDKLVRLWDVVDDEDRQGLARSLFDYVVYDLDAQRITDFRLKKWADEFIIIRGRLYEEDMLAATKTIPQTLNGLRNDLPHRGFEPLF